MTYEVNVEQMESELWQVTVEVRDGDNIILTGETTVATETQEAAHQYGERVFLPDLRRNHKQLTDLVFDWEVPDDAPDDAPESS